MLAISRKLLNVKTLEQQIEGYNTKIRAMLCEHRGMPVEHQWRAVGWLLWCGMVGVVVVGDLPGMGRTFLSILPHSYPTTL